MTTHRAEHRPAGAAGARPAPGDRSATAAGPRSRRAARPGIAVLADRPAARCRPGTGGLRRRLGADQLRHRTIGRLNAGTSGTPSSGPLNILVAGVDISGRDVPREQAGLHVGHDVSDNSDTLMLIHVPADHSYVQVVSLPRDSWVYIPGHGMNKINAAYRPRRPEADGAHGRARDRAWSSTTTSRSTSWASSR